jgi:hypothetical protein
MPSPKNLPLSLAQQKARSRESRWRAVQACDAFSLKLRIRGARQHAQGVMVVMRTMLMRERHLWLRYAPVPVKVNAAHLTVAQVPLGS